MSITALSYNAVATFLKGLSRLTISVIFHFTLVSVTAQIIFNDHNLERAVPVYHMLHVSLVSVISNYM